MRRLVCDVPAVLGQMARVRANEEIRRDRYEAARARKKFIEDFGYVAKKSGPLVRSPAIVVYVWVVARLDIDAPLKVVQDAAAPMLFEHGDDGVVRGLHVFMRRLDMGATRGPNVRAPLKPIIVVEAWDGADYQRAGEAIGEWMRWSVARFASLATSVFGVPYKPLTIKD